MCEFGVVLAVEPPALAGKKDGTTKSEPADRSVKTLSNRNKAKC